MEIVELSDEGLCCGAGGVFSLAQNKLATEIRELKTDSLNAVFEEIGEARIVSANPGCVTHLQAKGFEMKHPLEVLVEHLSEADTQG